jgi:hypothetical protein
VKHQQHLDSLQLRQLFPNASKSCLAANPENPRPVAKPQLPDRAGELALARKAEKARSDRVHIRFTSVRKRLLDPDNVIPKWTLDALRYAGVIRGDEPEKITLEVTQRKVAKGEEEHTLVEIFENPIPQP